MLNRRVLLDCLENARALALCGLRLPTGRRGAALRLTAVVVLAACGGVEPLPAFDAGSDTGIRLPDSGRNRFDGGAFDAGIVDPPMDAHLPTDDAATDHDSGPMDATAADSGTSDGGVVPPPEGVDDAMRWSITLLRGDVPATAANMSTWDDGDEPDPYAIIKLYDTLLDRELEARSAVLTDTTTPEWNAEVLSNVPAAMFVQAHDRLTLELWDQDSGGGFFDDAIGECEIPMAELDFSGSEFVFVCSAEASVDGPGFSVAMKIDPAEPPRTIPAPLQRFDIEVVSVSAPMAGDWDTVFDPRPDMLVGVTLTDTGLGETFSGETTQRDNATTATFQEQVVSNWPAAFIRGDNDLVVSLYDYDDLSNDLMGRCPISVESLDISGAAATVRCAAGDRTEGTVDFDAILRIGLH